LLNGDDSDGQAPIPTTASKDHYGVVKIFKFLVYARTRRRFWKAWDMLKKIFEDQPAILRCIQKTWVPLREQWAHYFTNRYQNFGARTTSPTEATNMNIKSFLLNGQSDISKLAACFGRMGEEQATSFRYEWLGKTTSESFHIEPVTKPSL